jgi:hypothetical protein
LVFAAAAAQDPSWVKDLGKTASCNVASSAVNRRKAASTIAQVRCTAGQQHAHVHNTLVPKSSAQEVSG